MPGIARCEFYSGCSQIGSAQTEAKPTAGRGVGDGQCIKNKVEYGSAETVGHNPWMIHPYLYVAW
jgi:hypothetical protein